MRFELITLGTSGAVPAPGRFCSSQLLCTENRDYLIDCGEGAQIRFQEHGGGYSRVDRILISHLHGDHFYGLPGLLTSWALGRRTEPLYLYAPPGLEKLLRAWLSFQPPWPYPVVFETVVPTGRTLIHRDEDVEIFAFPLRHGIATNGYLIRERQRPATIRPDRIDQYAIPYSAIPAIKAGGDLERADGTRIPNTELTHPAPPARSYAYCSDTRYFAELAEVVAGVDLLYHEATFLHELVDQAVQTLHTTAREAGQLARAAGVGRLILGHYSSRYATPEILQTEARRYFSNTRAANDGDRFAVAFQPRAPLS